jgi:hypothetical protein
MHSLMARRYSAASLTDGWQRCESGRRMKKILALALVLLVLIGGYGIAWAWAARQATDYVKSLETADGETAPRLSCEQFGIGGFPFGFDVTCTNATIQSGDVTFTVSGIKAAAEVYRPTHVLLFAQSPISVQDAFTGSSTRVDFTSLQASARLDGWRIARISLVADAPVWTDTVFGDTPIAKSAKLEVHLIDDATKHDAEKGLATLAQFAKVEGLDAPVWNIVAGNATFEGEITNLPDDVRTYGDADLLKRWQAANGRYLISVLKGGDSASSFDVTGTLGLDSGGRTEGQVKLHSTGVVERLAPLFPPEYKNWIVGTPGEDGSYSQTLNIAAGVVFSGLVPTGVIPPLF